MRHLVIILLTMTMAVLPARAQLRLGLKAGITTSSLKFDSHLLSSERRTGYTLGAQLELGLPIVGLGLEGSLMFTHHNDALRGQTRTFHRNYIEIPLRVKYSLALPALSRLVTPYAFTGPNIGLLCDESDDITWDNRASNLSWDAGFGLQLLGHVQLAASYSLGITKAFKQVGLQGQSITGRDRCWTVTAAYVF